MVGDDNLQRMKTLDDAWNAQDWEVFRKRHSSDTAVHWPGQPDPTLGRGAHQAESEAFFKFIENHLDNNPYKVMFASGDWTCTIAKWTGKMIGPWQGAGREGPSGDRKDVRTRVLHSRPMEERGDRRGKPVLRPSRLSEANRRVVGREFLGCSRQCGDGRSDCRPLRSESGRDVRLVHVGFQYQHSPALVTLSSAKNRGCEGRARWCLFASSTSSDGDVRIR